MVLAYKANHNSGMPEIHIAYVHIYIATNKILSAETLLAHF